MPTALFTKLVATASPFANTTSAGSITETADVRSWLFLLVSSVESEEDLTQLVPRSTQSNSNAVNTGSVASITEDDPSAEPSPQTAGNAIAPWQDDRSGKDDQSGNIEGSRAENTAGKLPPSTTANTTPAPSHVSADAKSREVALPQINRSLSASNSKKTRAANSSGHAPSTRHAPSSQPLQHTRTSKHSDAAGRRGGSPSSPSGGASNNNSLQMRDDDASYNSTMDSTGGIGGRNTPHSSSYVLSKRAIAAQKSRDATLHEKEFWANRLRLLRREMEQVEQSVAAANENALRQGAAQVEDAIRQQLQDEQARETKTRAERLEANRIQREAHNRSVREAQQASLAAKRSLCQARRKESVEATVFVEEQHSRELHRRSLLKEAVQQEKVVQVLVRARTRALKMEETRRLY
jgi:hypothetical protein